MNIYFYTIPSNEVLEGFRTNNRRFYREKEKLYGCDMAVGMQKDFEHKIKFIITKNRFGNIPVYDLDEKELKTFLFDAVYDYETSEKRK